MEDAARVEVGQTEEDFAGEATGCLEEGAWIVLEWQRLCIVLQVHLAQ